MEIVQTIQRLQSVRAAINTSVGFVPTMGALHDGHIALIKQARAENEIVIVSIFVNPTQFLAGEDLSTYPRKESSDIKICEMCKVDYLFMPSIESIYTQNEVLIKAPSMSYVLEGQSRPGHFDGVLQVVLKLFNLTQATKAYFGKKDAQQLALIQHMVNTLFLPIEIVPCEIVREKDGLALSSRNIYLTQEQRQEALLLSKSLYVAASLIGKGETSANIIKENIYKTLHSLEVEYVAVVNRQFKEIETIQLKNSIILIVVRFGSTRLLDNLWV